jgi:hypothetical protein
VRKNARAIPTDKFRQPVYPGYQWGEPLDRTEFLSVKRVGESLKIRAAMPSYLSQNRPCDFIRKYETARKERPFDKRKVGKDSPHIRFANADSEDDLIDFVRSFGPVTATAFRMKRLQDFSLPEMTPDGHRLQFVIEAYQDLAELKTEQKIYKAALGLILELAKNDAEFDLDIAQKQVAEIARGIQDWPSQWERERKARGDDPAWRAPARSIQRIADHAGCSRHRILLSYVDARIILCELLNMLPGMVFPNALEMHSAIRFGMRPLLYSVLRREFLHHHDTGICANTRCRNFFEIERGGQRYCNEECSRRQRQRDYWQGEGKTRRQEKVAKAKRNRRGSRSPTCS